MRDKLARRALKVTKNENEARLIRELAEKKLVTFHEAQCVLEVTEVTIHSNTLINVGRKG
jgi:hypothetical protein